LADLADPFDYSTHVNQLIQNSLLNTAPTSTLYRSHGNALAQGMLSGNVTNLDFVEYLLEKVPIQMPKTIWDRHR
jgi:hypothetical protein